LFIKVRAIGDGGLGNPFILDPNLKILSHGAIYKSIDSVSLDPMILFIITLIMLMIILFIFAYVLTRGHRFCKTGGMINEQSSFSPTLSPIIDSGRTDEIYELQTLIPPATHNVVINSDKNSSENIDLNSEILNRKNLSVLNAGDVLDAHNDKRIIKSDQRRKAPSPPFQSTTTDSDDLKNNTNINSFKAIEVTIFTILSC
jgi:hypothetical protein